MTNQSHPIRVRFAPSPTGELHVGGARTALYDYLLAKQQGGQIVLRVEDTDQKRYVRGSMERFLDDLHWLGIEFNEGPEQGGPYAPYLQSERTDYYRDIAHQLVKADAAYLCFCTPERLAEVREAQQARGEQPRYDRHCRSLSVEELRPKLEAGLPYVSRLKVPESGSLHVDDLIRGRVTFDLTTIDDQVLMKSDGFPTYHLAVVADDHAMAITHVIRGEEWLPSTPKHILIYQALGWQPPLWVHVPLMLATDRKKLSKRIHGSAVWVQTYRERGYLAEAFVNYMALVGWNPGGDNEFFTLAELAKAFSLDRVHKAGAIFDEAKLNAFQRHYVSHLLVEELVVRLERYLTDQSLPIPRQPLFGKLVSLVQDRLGAFEKFPDLVASLTMFHEDYPVERLVFKKSTVETTKEGLRAASQTLTSVPAEEWADRTALEASLTATVTASAGTLTNGDLFWPVRVALTGAEKSLPPPDCLWVLGREESLRRLVLAQAKLGASV